MQAIPTKPRASAARHALKAIKDGFDDSSLDSHELLAELNVRKGMSAEVKAYRGEFYHQLALRKWRRGEISQAYKLLKLSVEVLDGNPLGQARSLRDMGMLELREVDTKLGLATLQRALLLHEQDIANAKQDSDVMKGQRQQLITQTYVWRAQIILGAKQSRFAKRQLIDLSNGPDFDFCIRDRKVIIDFLVPITRGVEKRDLLAAQAAILLERRKRIDLARSCVTFVIDLQFSIASSLIRKLFRRE